MPSPQIRPGAEFCEKCGAENDGERSWIRKRPAKLPTLLCPACAKALSAALSEFVEEWLGDESA